MIKKDALVLFQGDSITDCGRSRNDDKQLGNGYASMVAARFNALYPDDLKRKKNNKILRRSYSSFQCKPGAGEG